MKTYKAKFKYKTMHFVQGQDTRLKGYKAFRFFEHKVAKEWQIREYTTGLRVGSGTTLAKAKISAKEYLGIYTKKEIRERILESEVLNE